MVIHEEIQSTASKYLVNVEARRCAANNDHVYELDQPQSEVILRHPVMTSSDSEKKDNKDKNSRKRNKKSASSCSESVEAGNIDPEDLAELRSVYKKCKAVVKKIETKYGHLLNLEGTESKSGNKSDDSEDTGKCECTANKKIIFDDEGKEITAETDLEKHICPKKLKRRHSHVQTNNTEGQRNLQVEYETPDLTLPDDLQSLSKILHDPNIEVTYRNKVIHKMKMLKQEYFDEIRFNRQSLIEKAKSSPDEMFDFKGTNLKNLPGYKC